MNLFSKVRKMLGMCAHGWGEWRAIVDATGGIAGYQRKCGWCPKIQYNILPDGH